MAAKQNRYIATVAAFLIRPEDPESGPSLADVMDRLDRLEGLVRDLASGNGASPIETYAVRPLTIDATGDRLTDG